MATYVDDFVDGLTPYTGDKTGFTTGTGPYGSTIGGLGYTGAAKNINRTIASTNCAKVSVWAIMTAEAADDSAAIWIRTGTSYRVVVWPRREAAFDSLRRPFVFMYGGAEAKQPIAVALALNQWHRFEVIIAAGAGNSSCAVYNAAGTLLGSVAFAGNYTPTTVDSVYLSTDPVAGGVPTQFAQLRIYEDLLPATGLLSIDLVTRRVSSQRVTYLAAHTSLVADTLYTAQGTNVVPLFSGAAQTGIWRSKVIRRNRQPSFGWARVEGDYPCILRTYGDGVLHYTTPAITSNAAVRLPVGRFREWYVEVESAARVVEVVLATSSAELVG